ncbi:hypothetical protein V2J09_022172 [Rumex salicifolius]
MTSIHSGSKPTSTRKKKRGLMHALYSVFFGTGHTDAASKKTHSPATTTAAPTATSISMFVSSIRPLHIAEGGCQSPPPPRSPSAASSLAASKSSYASADFGDRVFEVDEEMKTGEIERGENDGVEEEIVISTAEMSIGKVYQQIRLQALNSIGVVRGSN